MNPQTPDKDTAPDMNAIEREAIGLVRKERVTWETATAFITDRVAFQMRNLIRQMRKNYWGVFDELVDSQTGRRKIWIPLTESTVEAVIKNIDLDTKDINFRAKRPDKAALTELVRTIVKNYLDETYFGEDLDDFERRMAIDGTAVWKTYETNDDSEADKGIKRVPVDLLNVYIDPTSPSIQEAYRFTERTLMTEDEVKGMAPDWINTDGIQGTSGLPRTDPTFPLSAGAAGSTTKYVDIWECWGKFPLYLMTGKEADRKEEFDGHIIVSGLDKGTAMRVHMIEKNPYDDARKPYEEAWYTRVPGRWYGKGVAEKLMWLQLWINTIVNIRINRSYVSQLGLFKVKRNAGITPQALSRLTANGVISVDNMEDIQQMVVQEASMASYKDEDIIKDWSERVTSAFEVVTGEMMPSTTPATNAVLQNRNAQSQFVLIKEGLGFFLQRWIKRHLLPMLTEHITKGDVVRQTGDPEFLRAFDQCFVDAKLAEKVDEMTKNGQYIDPTQVLQERDRLLAQMQVKGDDRYIKLDDEVDLTEYDVQVFVTNEEVDKGVLAQNLLTALQAAPEYKDQILTQIFDVMGVGPFQAKPQPAAGQSVQQVGPDGQPVPVPGQVVSPDKVQRQVQAQPQSPVVQTTQANIPH